MQKRSKLKLFYLERPWQQAIIQSWKIRGKIKPREARKERPKYKKTKNTTITSQFVVYVRVVEEHTSVYNSRIKRIWVGLVERLMTNRKVIRDIVRVRPKHGKISCSDFMVSKHNLRASQKLTYQSSCIMGRTGRESGCRNPISRGWSGRYKWYQR